MKKLTAIALMLLLCFNWYGYRLAIYLLETRIDNALQASVDRQQFNESELVELRIPVNLPYYNDWDSFESYEGETTINGQHYRYVKRKVSKGELILLCIPNKNKTKLVKAGNEFFKQVNDLQQSPAKKSPGKETTTKSAKEYTFTEQSNETFFIVSTRVNTTIRPENIFPKSIPPPHQPPDC